jgi:hypothetical protein
MPSAARKAGPTVCRADDAAAVAAGASDHVHGTTKDAEGADHPHLHGTAAVAGATGLLPITVAPAGECDHERTTAGAADAADAACTSRTAFFSKSCIPLSFGLVQRRTERRRHRKPRIARRNASRCGLYSKGSESRAV